MTIVDAWITVDKPTTWEELDSQDCEYVYSMKVREKLIKRQKSMILFIKYRWKKKFHHWGFQRTSVVFGK